MKEQSVPLSHKDAWADGVNVADGDDDVLEDADIDGLGDGVVENEADGAVVNWLRQPVEPLALLS